MLNDLRYALRMLLKKPGFTTVVVFTLALGIGVNATVFSLVDTVFGGHLPIKDYDRIVNVWGTNLPNGGARLLVSIPDFLDWKQQNHVFEDVAAFSFSGMRLTDIDQPVRLQIQEVSCEIFSLLGVRPSRGRDFLPEECRGGHSQVVILSDKLWQRIFNSDPTILGRNITLNNQAFTVVGLMPRGFRYPGMEVDLWITLPLDSTKLDRAKRSAMVIGRLKSGISIDQAQAEMTAIANSLEDAYPATNSGWGVRVVLLIDELNRKSSSTIYLFGSVFLVLLIACVNVANLLLARSSIRQKEMAVRASLGASRLQLIGQLLTEGLSFALIGGILGLLIASWGMNLVRNLLADILPLDSLRMNMRLFAFSAVLSVLTTLIFGLVPAIHGSKIKLNEALQRGGMGAGGGSGSHRLREYLVVFEIMLAVLLLGLCGLFMSIWFWLGKIEPGFDPKNLLVMTVSPPQVVHSNASDALSYFRKVMQQVRTVPGVEDVSLVDRLPMQLNDQDASRPVLTEGSFDNQARVSVAELTISSGYLKVMHIPLIRGRDFSDMDFSQNDSIALISETLARRCWPNQDPLAKRFRLGGQNSPTAWIVVVGVVADVMNGNKGRPPLPVIYNPLRQGEEREMMMVIRTPFSPAEMATAMKQASRDTGVDQSPNDLKTMEDLLREGQREYERMVGVFGTFAVLALALGAIGVFSVMSCVVAERTPEIGIRMALGARPNDILWNMLRQGMILALSGMGLGLAFTVVGGRIVAHYLPAGIRPYVDWMNIFIALVITAVALLACYVPARRATKIDPMGALRYE